MRFPPKLVSVLCVMQAFFIVMTWMIVGGLRKFYTVGTAGWENAPEFLLGGRLFYFCGPLLLVVPLIWGYIATTRAEVGHGFVVISEEQGGVGWATTGAVVAFCGWVACLTFSWVFSPWQPW